MASFRKLWIIWTLFIENRNYLMLSHAFFALRKPVVSFFPNQIVLNMLLLELISQYKKAAPK